MQNMCSSILITACMLFCSSCTFKIVTPVENASSADLEPQTLSKAVQHSVAVNEAGHALARYTFFGPTSVREMVVHTECCVENLHEDFGHVSFSRDVVRMNLDLTRKQMVVYFAGRAADLIVNGEPTSGASADMFYANQQAWAMYISNGLSGSVIYYEQKDAPNEIKAQVHEEINDANAYAEEFISANASVVSALAVHIMNQEVDDKARTLTREELEDFFKSHAIIDPRAE